MLFKDIIEGRYRVFARQGDDERARNIGIVKYVENLASMAGVNISSWDCMAIFRVGDAGNKLIDDKNEINRLFFTRVEELAASAPVAEGQIISDEMRQQIRAAEARHITSLLAKEQQNADANISSAMSKYREYETYIKRAGEHFAAIRRMSGQNSNIEDQIRQVMAMPFYEFFGVQGGTKIVFVTRGDVTLSHRNDAAGVNINLNFGRYKVLFDMTDFSLKVLTHERNLSSGGYHHPHIAGSAGSICWGTAASTATRLLACAQFAEPMTLLQTVLTNYNPASPYHTMERFQEAVGTPEEHRLRDEQTDRHIAVRAVMAPIDALELNVDLRQEPIVVPVEAAPLANPEPGPMTVEEQAAASAARRTARREARAAAAAIATADTSATTFTVTNTTNNTAF